VRDVYAILDVPTILRRREGPLTLMEAFKNFVARVAAGEIFWR
jgi:hypothetical protein